MKRIFCFHGVHCVPIHLDKVPQGRCAVPKIQHWSGAPFTDCNGTCLVRPLSAGVLAATRAEEESEAQARSFTRQECGHCFQFSCAAPGHLLGLAVHLFPCPFSRRRTAASIPRGLCKCFLVSGLTLKAGSEFSPRSVSCFYHLLVVTQTSYLTCLYM